MGKVFPNGAPQLDPQSIGNIFGPGSESGGNGGGQGSRGGSNNVARANLVSASNGDPNVNSLQPEYQNYNQQQALRRNPNYFNNQQFANQFMN